MVSQLQLRVCCDCIEARVVCRPHHPATLNFTCPAWIKGHMLCTLCAASSPRPKRWTASSNRSSLASEQTGLEPSSGSNELPKFPLPEMFGFLDEDG